MNESGFIYDLMPGETKKTDEKAPDVSWMGSDGIMYTYSQAPTRPCGKCRKEFVWDGNEYKKLCPTCYGCVVKKCASCKINNLPVDAKTWQVTCTDCWLKEKAKKYGTCPTCPPEKSTHLRRRLDRPSCEECAVRLKRA